MTSEDIMTRLRHIRKTQRMSQDALAMAIGQSGNNGYISHLENGRYPDVRVNTIIRVADALGYEIILQRKP